jgi:hypothetical protein
MNPIVSRMPSWSRRAALVAVFSMAGFLSITTNAPAARAEDGEEGDDDAPEAVESKIRAQMEKILKLMRDNEKAILAASQGSAKRPDGVTVPPPESPPTSASHENIGKPEGGGDRATPPARGDDISKKMEDLIRSTQHAGGSIPKELEELVKLIPP